MRVKYVQNSFVVSVRPTSIVTMSPQWQLLRAQSVALERFGFLFHLVSQIFYFISFNLIYLTSQECHDGQCIAVESEEETSKRVKRAVEEKKAGNYELDEDELDQDECIYGDNLITSAFVGEKKLPSDQMSCPEFMTHLLKNDKSPFVYCANSTFRAACCQTCKSKINFVSFYLYLIKNL